LELLHQVAEATGGRFISAADAEKPEASAGLFENRQPRSAPREIWRSLLIAALLLLPLDVGLRRVHLTREDINAAAGFVLSRIGALAPRVAGIGPAAEVGAPGHESVGRLKASRLRVRLRGEDKRAGQGPSQEIVPTPVSAPVQAPLTEQLQNTMSDSSSSRLPAESARGVANEDEKVEPDGDGSLAGRLLRIKQKQE
ncbi:MAG TPA: hypothetical protein VFV34_00815, partial [Blastocatellia bacterium]|nr:hypothetical protein [Blastocatellia bacterium]